MSVLVRPDSANHPRLLQLLYLAGDCALGHLKQIGELSISNKWIHFQIFLYLQCTRLQAYMIYTVIFVRYFKKFIRSFAIFQKFGNAILQEILYAPQPVDWQIVILVAFEAEAPQSVKARAQI